MAKINELERDLGRLRKEYDELHRGAKAIPPSNPDDVSRAEQMLVESGQLVVDFYEQTFIPQYFTEDGEVFRQVGNQLKGIASMAKDHCERQNYFGLRVLFIPKGSKKGDPDNLDGMIASVESASGIS